jgi:hypothetical protein
MNKRILSLLALSLLLIFSGCGEKKQKDIIVAKKETSKEPAETQRMSNYNQTHDVKWLGKIYKVEVKRYPDTSLDIVKVDENTKFYDNKITVRILRQDGTEFFKRTFTKRDFSKYISEKNLEHSALLGIVFVEAQGDNLDFASSVGSPDVTSDEYVPLNLKISRLGSVDISDDSQLDTQGSSNKSSASSEEDEGGVTE